MPTPSRVPAVSRRAVLRGAAATIALPVLDSLAPRVHAREQPGGAIARRLAVLYRLVYPAPAEIPAPKSAGPAAGKPATGPDAPF